MPDTRPPAEGPASRRNTQGLRCLPPYPSLFQLNTRVMLRAIGDTLGRPATLDDIPDAELDRIAAQGFDWLYCLGVWSTGDAGRQVSRAHTEWRREFETQLPDLEERDICGSCFAVTAYSVHPAFGGDDALRRLRRRLHARGLRLMLDFVPNHMALDHPWVRGRPELFVQGSRALREREPANYTEIATSVGPVVLAHGRDPYFPGWPDTLQLDYGCAATQDAMRSELLKAATLCDGLRCDMAMLILPDVFQRTWGHAAAPFWPGAIHAVRERRGEFTFMAEVYWDLEWRMLQEGFDYAYDKTLYDRAVAGAGRGIREHLRAGLDYQRHLARFLENHDEPRAAGTFAWDKHRAAAVLSFLSPGLRFFHQGQFEGRSKRVSIHLDRAPTETPDEAVGEFYRRILDLLRRKELRSGAWRLLEPTEAWEGNWTWDGFVPFCWEGDPGQILLVIVNFQPNQAQCYVGLPFRDLAGRQHDLVDLLGPARYRRNGDDLVGRGLFLDMPAWGFHVFALCTAE